MPALHDTPVLDSIPDEEMEKIHREVAALFADQPTPDDPAFWDELDRRSAELEADPSIGMTEEQVECALQETIDRCRAKR